MLSIIWDLAKKIKNKIYFLEKIKTKSIMPIPNMCWTKALLFLKQLRWMDLCNKMISSVNTAVCIKLEHIKLNVRVFMNRFRLNVKTRCTIHALIRVCVCGWIKLLLQSVTTHVTFHNMEDKLMHIKNLLK